MRVAEITSNSANSMMILGSYDRDANSEVEMMREEKVRMNEKLDEFAAMLKNFQSSQNMQ